MATRRDEICEAARGLFAKQGYSGTSIRDIADATGLLPGSLYAHFSSKAELVREIVGTFYDELLPAQQEASAHVGTGAERLEVMIAAVQDVCQRHPNELTILHYDWQALSTLEEFTEIRKLSFDTLDCWHRVVNAGIDDGSVKAIMDAETIVRVITSAIHGVLDHIRYQDWQHGDSGEDAMNALATVLLTGLTTE
jgi:AcrR family transcriptional regulator